MDQPISPAARGARFVRAARDNPHHLLLALVCLAPLAAMPVPVWLQQTIAGLGMGLVIFIMASGLSLTFGLMGVLNLGHGALVTMGAYVGASVLVRMADAAQADSIMSNLGAIAPALLLAAIAVGLAGFVFERVIVRPFYGDHLKQILATVGGAIILEQLLLIFWGPNEMRVERPAALLGSVVVGDVALEKFRLFAGAVGLLIYIGMVLAINRTKVGLLIRAGVENPEMVEAQGYRIRLLFIAVFAAGAALAGIGGVMWSMYQQIATIGMGAELLVLVIIVSIIGGLGSITGCFYSALIVGLINNYVGVLLPGAAEFTLIGLTIVLLLWRPQGLIPLVKV